MSFVGSESSPKEYYNLDMVWKLDDTEFIKTGFRGYKQGEVAPILFKDGFENSIVYLTDVELLDYDWDDVMLQFDGNDNLDYVEFAYWTPSYDTSRFFVLYDDLCSIYGSPVIFNNSMYSWYGGDGIGFVNLGYQNGGDVFYTVLAFGV